MSRRELWTFLAVTFGLGFLFQALAIRSGVSSAGRGWLMLTMWSPAAGAMTSRTGRNAALAALKRSGGRWLLIALLVGWSMTGLQALLLWALGGGAWNSEAF